MTVEFYVPHKYRTKEHKPSSFEKREDARMKKNAPRKENQNETN